MGPLPISSQTPTRRTNPMSCSWRSKRRSRRISSFPDYQIFLDTGIPLWISYRRTIGKIVGVDGEDITEDGDRFGLAARKFEQMGVSAVLVNCLPVEEIDGVATWLRQFTNITLGGYPNWGHYLRYEWDWSSCPAPEVFVEHARRWASEGMQIIGGCCGVRPLRFAPWSKPSRSRRASPDFACLERDRRLRDLQ